MSDTENKDPKQGMSKDKFKDTVFLPKTEFPMRGNLPDKEPAMVQNWQKMELYAKIRAASKDKKKWILHDGPPYANGDIHMGHALNKILKDVINKSWQMLGPGADAPNGYDAPYVPGWDCHGLPIEWKIEESYRAAGKDKDTVEPLHFRAECRDFAQKWVDIQSNQFRSLGVIGDWENPYLTMTKHGEAQIAREIHKFLKNGGLYRGVKPVMWSTVEQTALAEAEVEYKEHKSVTVWVKFPIIKSPNKPELEGINVVIWTTTPWTLPSNRAIGFGKDIEYSVFEVTSPPTPPAGGGKARSAKGEKLVIATSLAGDVKEKSGIVEWKSLGTFKGADVAGTICQHSLNGHLKPSSRTSPAQDGHDPGSIQNSEWIPASAGMTPEEDWKPVYDFDVPLLEGDFVTEESGTGFVHIAPGHGADDFYLGQQHGIEVTDNVTDDGKFREHVPLFGGDVIYDENGKMGNGNFTVIKALDEAKALLAKGSLRHEYPHSWRSKAPVIFRTTPQWFIAMDSALNLNSPPTPPVNGGEARSEGGRKGSTLRERALNAIKDTNWVPAKGQARITAMIEGRPDWCISRQRAWGVPIALFVDKKTNEPLQDDDVFTRIADAFEEHGADAWWSCSPQEFLGNKYNAEDYDQIFDIVDVWFESGSTHTFVVDDRDDLLLNEEAQQADLYLEGSDQHRGWFHSSLLEACGTKGHAPYKNVLTHGFVLDEKGYKMSKSDGNVVDPLKLMKQSGADILRLWTMTSDYAEDIRIGQDMIKNTSDLYRRIRNTLRFLLGALDGFTASEKVDLSDPAKLPELEQLMLHELAQMDQKIRAHIQNYEFGKLATMLHQFCNNELSSFYFDIRKDRLYCDDPSSFERRATRTVISHIFDCLVTWLAPILSFTAEEAWAQRPAGVFKDAESVHLREFPKIPANWKNDNLFVKWQKIVQIRSVLNAAIEPLRASKELGSSLESQAKIYLIDNYKNHIENVDLSEIGIISNFSVKFGNIPDDAFTTNALQEMIGVKIIKADGEKCVRCWKYLPEVSNHADHICDRCDAVINKKKAA